MAGLAAATTVAQTNWIWRVPAAPTLQYISNADWRGYDALEIDVEALSGSTDSADVTLYFFLENKQGQYFQSQPGLGLDGTRQTLRVDLHEDRATLWSVNARRSLAPDALRWVRAWGLKAHTEAPQQGRIRIGEPRWIAARGERVRLNDVRYPNHAVRGQTAAVRFAVSGFRGNPYDSEDIEATLEVEGPGGVTRVPAYFKQDYHVRRHPGTGQVEPVATGRPVWQANWTPDHDGLHQLRVVVDTQSTTLKHAAQEAVRVVTQVAEPASPHAAVFSGAAASFQAPAPARLYQRQNGDWLPVPPEKQAEAIWHVRLDWTPHWGRFTGMGEFDDLAAWRFEQVLHEHGNRLARPLLLFDERELGRRGVYNWLSHPFNRDNEGHLSRPDLMYADPKGARVVKNRARYLWARFGAHPAVSGLLVQVAAESPITTAWVQRMASELQQAYPGLVVVADNPGLPARVWERSLEAKLEWQTDSRLAPDGEVVANEAPSRVRVQAKNSRTAAATARSVFHWAGASDVAFDMVVSPSSPDTLSVKAFFRNGAGHVFESGLHRLEPDAWVRLRFPLDRLDAWVSAQDSARHPHAYDMLNVREIGLRFFSVDETNLVVDIKAATLRGDYRYAVQARPPLAIGPVSGAPTSVPQYGRFEAVFDINRIFTNPYDPREVNAMLEVTDPTGVKRQHPAFFYEPWRLVEKDGREVAEPEGAPSWRARFSPWTLGRHTWRLTVAADGETAAFDGEFDCVLGTAPGFIRVAQADPRYFEFTGGEFFFPIGHNLRSPSDDRAHKQGAPSAQNAVWAEAAGTGAYARWFERMSENGGNFARVWMAPWWGGLEWHRDYEDYHGLGYYNQANAARIDRVIELAETHGIYLNLETLNHGALSSRVDADWEHNPLNKHTSPEGYLSAATEFFHSARAQREHRHRLRYIVARWGYSRSIAWWGLLTEAEWVEAYYRAIRGNEKMPNVPWIPRPFASREHRPLLIDWLVETARFVQETDAHPHPVSAHFSMPQHGTELWGHDGIDIVHNNAYTAWIQWWRAGGFSKSDGVADVIRVFADHYDRHAQGKPLMIGEWGGTPYGSSSSHLAAELHTGLWCMAMTRCAGVAGFWWWNFVDAEDQYPRFRAVAAFLENEDRRGKHYHWQRAELSFPDAVPRGDFSERQGMILFNEREALAYVFSKAANRRQDAVAPRSAEDPRFPPSGTGVMTVPDLVGPGRYRLEIWEPFTGQKIAVQEVALDDDNRTLPLPSHRVDVAIKLKPLAASDAPEGP